MRRVPAAISSTITYLLDWLRELRLEAWPAALIGGAGGLIVGWRIVESMRRHAVFTQPYQDITAGAALLALWLCIGVIAGLAVLAPLDEE